MRLNQGWQALVLSASLFLCAAVPASAQTITRWTLRVYQVGAPQPLLKPIELVLGEDVTCNLDPATVETARKNLFLAAVWNDPTAIEKVCVWVDPGTGPLLSSSLAGSYEATLTASSVTATSRESARVPLTIPDITRAIKTAVPLPK
jgi:hypothetical protein